MKEMNLLQRKDISDLKAINVAQQAKATDLKRALDMAQGLNVDALRTMRRYRARSTRNTILWALVAFAFGWIAHGGL